MCCPFSHFLSTFSVSFTNAQVDFLDVDEIVFTANLSPCGDPASAQFEVAESDAGIDWSKTYSAGDSEEFPIPGLSVAIPVLGDADVELAVDIEGDASALSMNFGLDACITVLGYSKCGSSLTSELPYYILSGKLFVFREKKQVSLLEVN